VRRSISGGVRSTYPDLRLTVEQQIAEGEWVVSRVTMRGTHKGEWLGIRPTGKPIRVTAVNIDRVVDGRIVEHGGAANLLGPLLELGAIVINRG
jgi:predicted ester cyclase